MMLYVSLKGEAEEELEWCDIAQINHANGIDNIIEALKQPLMTKSIYLKRRYLHEYEYVQRYANESIRSFCNRYGRIEKSLKSVDINVGGMYDSESRGSRLLERMRLGLEQQRLILVASGQSLDFEMIREAAQVQFPDHRPTPPVQYLREFDGAKNDANGAQPRQPPRQLGGKNGSHFHGKDKGKGVGKGSPSANRHTTYVTEVNEAEELPDDQGDAEGPTDDLGDTVATNDETNENEDGQTEDAEEGDPADDLEEVARCLTVTARRLKGLTLGRKFSGGSKTIAQRKQESHCAACGAKGHWQGDSECPHASNNKGGKSGKSNSSPKGDAQPSNPGKKVLTVQHGGGKRLVTFSDERSGADVETNSSNKEAFGTYFTAYMVKTPISSVHQVFTNTLNTFAEFLVLDTACQRTCCSTKWFELWESMVHDKFDLFAKKTPNAEPFEFGHGPAQYSHMHAYLPVAFDYTLSTTCLIGTCIINTTNDIPLLGSHHLLSKLHAVIDLPRGVVCLDGGIEVPIEVINGHLAVKITCFPPHPKSFHEVWHQLGLLSDDEHADVEMICMADSDKLKSSNLQSIRPDGTSSSMASSVASHDHSLVHGREVPSHSDQQSRSTAPSTEGMAGSSRPHVDGGKEHPPEEGDVGMRARSDSKIGQQARKVQQVPHVRQKMGVGPRKQSMGRTIAKAAATAAFTVLFHGINLQGSQVHPGQYDGPEATAFCSFQEGIYDPSHGASQVLYSQEIPASIGPGGEDVGRRSGLEPGQRLPFVSGNMKNGNKTWVTGHLKSVGKIYEKEMRAYECLPTHHDHVNDKSLADVVVIDLLEVFAGAARVSELAPRFGLSACQPFDLIYDIDLKTSEGEKLLVNAVRKLRPLLLLVAWPCGPWSIFNQNMNYSDRPHELEDIRDEDRPLVRLGARLCKEQSQQGRFYLGENPLRSAIWNEDDVQELRDLPENWEVTCEAGAYGAETLDGFPIQKPHRWVTNSEYIAQNLTKKLTPEQKLYTVKVEGKETARSGQYCDGLACAILDGLQKEAARKNPQRFHRVPGSSEKHQVYYAKPVEDEDAWQDILDEVERRFQNTYKRPFEISDSDELMNKIKQLVPWEMSRVQAAWTPSARRWPMDIPFTHRGCAMRTIAGKFMIEHEDMASVPYPRQRFADPIRVGIFFFGVGEDEHFKTDTKEAPADEKSEKYERVTGVTTDIYFEGGPPMSREMKTSIARLHCNLGHASKQEIIRILAAAGKLDSRIMGALDALRCGSCIRLSKTVKPNPSSTASATKYSGAFGDHLQADIIFIRILTGEAVPVLGIVCTSTNFHAAKVLNSRHADEVLAAMIEIWYKPLGLPISITLDADTAFLSSNQAWHQNLGIEYDIIPTEEAWRLGKIGKRNALMRTLAERLIDQNATCDRKHLEEILVAVLFSMNSSTYTYGRSPYQAVFGRIPRPVGDLISDSKSLTISPQVHPEQQALQPELLRAEALTALAQFSASQAVRRALLRKTRNQNDLSDLQPGQAVAFWRMSGKSRQHKKGSWNLARFLAYDPDRKSCWIQLGKTSLRVGTTQLRPASGWEAWTPSDSDLKLIREAENNFAAGLWLDETAAEGPNEDDMMNVDEELFQFHPTKARRTQEPRPLQAEENAMLGDDQFWEPEPSAEVPFPGVPMPEASDQPYNMATLPQQVPVQSSQPQQLNIHQQAHQNILQQQQQTNTYNFDQRQITVNVDSPTYQQYGPQPTFGALPPTPRTRGRSRTPNRRTGTTAPETPAITDPATGSQPEQRPAGLEQTPALGDNISGDVQMANTPATAAQTNLLTHHVSMTTNIQQLLDLYDDDTASMKCPHWDGSPNLSNPYYHNQWAYQAYLNSSKRKHELRGLSEPERPDWDVSDDDEDLSLSDNRHLSRQELKQLDREIPWREIVQMPAAVKEKYIEAAAKEYAGWMKWTGIRPLTDEEADTIFADPAKRKRIMKSRAAYRDKSRGLGGLAALKAKCRAVIIGCGDPDLRQLTRDSPTPTRLAEYVILSIAAAGRNSLFDGSEKQWFLWLSDVQHKHSSKEDKMEPSEAVQSIWNRPKIH